MSKKQQKQLDQIAEAQSAAQFRKLGWEELDNWEDPNYRWRCAKCKAMKLYIDCGICMRCEACYKCNEK